MEMFQLVAGIEAVKKVMRDQYDNEPLLPPIESEYTALGFKKERAYEGTKDTGPWESASPAAEHEERVA